MSERSLTQTKIMTVIEQMTAPAPSSVMALRVNTSNQERGRVPPGKQGCSDEAGMGEEGTGQKDTGGQDIHHK